MIRIVAEVTSALALGGFVIYINWRRRRRSWLSSYRDESMRRHIDQHYS
jgi:hypothetical protein